MKNKNHSETIRRTTIKALLWRFIGIFWTWGGAYVIILLLPDNKKNAITIATLITAWHHSTRMFMYFIYERIWSKIQWGKIQNEPSHKISLKAKLIWILSVICAIILVFFLLLKITPKIKHNQKKIIKQKTISQTSTPPNATVVLSSNNFHLLSAKISFSG